MSVPATNLISSRADGCSGTWPAVTATARPPHGAPGEERARNACKRWTPVRGVAGMARKWERKLSAADAALRERITELSVHIPCGGLRGPLQRKSRAYPGLPIRWQSCRDEDAPQKWAACDVSRERDLCIICFRATAGGTSRWAWLACDDCRAVNDAIESRWGFRPFALGRHSLMNGIGVRGGSPPDVQGGADRSARGVLER